MKRLYQVGNIIRRTDENKVVQTDIVTFNRENKQYALVNIESGVKPRKRFSDLKDLTEYFYKKSDILVKRFEFTIESPYANRKRFWQTRKRFEEMFVKRLYKPGNIFTNKEGEVNLFAIDKYGNYLVVDIDTGYEDLTGFDNEAVLVLVDTPGNQLVEKFSIELTTNN